MSASLKVGCWLFIQSKQSVTWLVNFWLNFPFLPTWLASSSSIICLYSFHSDTFCKYYTVYFSGRLSCLAEWLSLTLLSMSHSSMLLLLLLCVSVGENATALSLTYWPPTLRLADTSNMMLSVCLVPCQQRLAADVPDFVCVCLCMCGSECFSELLVNDVSQCQSSMGYLACSTPASKRLCKCIQCEELAI